MCSRPHVGLRDDHLSISGSHCHTPNSFAPKNAPTSGNLSPVERSKSPVTSCFQDGGPLDGRIDDRCVELNLREMCSRADGSASAIADLEVCGEAKSEAARWAYGVAGEKASEVDDI